MAPLDNSFARKIGKRMPRSHKADTVKLGELALGIDDIAGFQLSALDALPDCTLNPAVGRLSILAFRSHSDSITKN